MSIRSLGRWVRLGAFVAVLGLGLAALAVVGFVKPPAAGSVSRESRLSMFPREGLRLRADAEVLWSERQIPYVVAEDPRDVPYLLGLVHAHLRIGQMEMIRRVARGRISEMAGPFTRDIDATLRALDLDRVVPEIAAGLPDDSRQWMGRYVEGVNDYRAKTKRRPFELRLLGIGKGEPWTIEDVLALGRLVSVDINWLRWFRTLPLRDEAAYDEVMARLGKFAADGTPSFGPGVSTPLDPLVDRARPGSNSLVVAGSRTASGAPMIASDPHVGLSLPSLFVLAGYRSPAGAAVGMMYPGVPYVLIGRNEHIAWGGTNMMGISSSLFDVSSVDPSDFQTRTERIGVRWWRDRRVKILESEHGPVVSRAPLFRSLGLGATALRWRGHEPSDEATPMHRVNHARTFEEFRTAFESYAVSGQNLLYADAAGHIGQLAAIEAQPWAGRTASGTPADPSDPQATWGEGIPSTDLPFALDPPKGWLVSSNNTPVLTDPPLTASGNSNDRVHRFAELIEGATAPLTPEDLMRIQQDVRSPESVRTLAVLVAALERVPDLSPLAVDLAGWDGSYSADSRGAAVYQWLLSELIDGSYTERYGRAIAEFLRGSVAVHAFVREDVASGEIEGTELAGLLRRGAREIPADRVWGDVHRLRLAHSAGSVPVVGRWYRYGELPAPGTSSTIQKRAHDISKGRHRVTFGAAARHVSDLSDPDANWFVLLGGQDGWLGSENFLDQVDLFREGRYVRFPLTLEAVRASFPDAMKLEASATR